MRKLPLMISFSVLILLTGCYYEEYYIRPNKLSNLELGLTKQEVFFRIGGKGILRSSYMDEVFKTVAKEFISSEILVSLS